jgi:hypothetical protein
MYGAWGLGISSWMHVLSPAGFKALFKLGREKGIWNRPTESGSRWQTGGSWAVDAQGVVKWGGVSGRADDVPNFKEAMEVLEGKGSKL